MQGMVGYLNKGFVTNLLLSLTMKKIENRLISGDIMGKSLGVLFFSDTV